MSKLSLKYRIAVVIFLLEGVMMTFVLGLTLSRSLEVNTQQLEVNELVLVDLLGNLSRIALFTGEYDDLQPYLEQVIADPHIRNVVVKNRDGRVVASSDVRQIGRTDIALENKEKLFWRTKVIDNSAGALGSIAINFSHEALWVANQKALKMGIRIALVGMTVIAVVGLISGFFLTRRLDRLAAAARALASGDLLARTELRGGDEIGMLGQTFDQMADNIRQTVADLRGSEEQLRRAHDDLEQRIIERTAELAVARDQAMDASRAKGSFIANMSHELRTPLNAIIGYSEMLLEEASETTVESGRDLAKIRGAAQHLLALINDILDLSKIEAGKMELQLEDFDVRAMLETVVATSEPLVARNNNRLVVDIAPRLGSMHSDATRIRQALLNLLSNASKFCHDGTITLTATQVALGHGGTLCFSVRDTGVGIAPENHEKVFAAFTQADTSTTRRYGGTGLGLTITQRFCRMMGGDIALESAPGVGSRFTITLPRRAPVHMTQAATEHN